MSLTTHRFQNFETLARAKEWLGQMGFPSDHIEVSSTGLPTMTIQTEFSRLPEVEMILNAAELTDPEGWPSYNELGNLRVKIVDVTPEPAPLTRSSTTPIGWHPDE